LYIEANGVFGVEVERVENSDVSLVINLDVCAPVLSLGSFFVFLIGWMAVDEILDGAIDKNRYVSGAGGIELNALVWTALLGGSYFDLLAGDRAVDFVCERLPQGHGC
jgi:hypothetical protein